MTQAIQNFIDSKSIAVVGFSRSGKKFGNYAYKELDKRGYQVFAVHPTETQIDGVQCYPDLASLKDKVDGVFLSVPGDQALSVLDDAAAMNIMNVWLQKGAETDAVLEKADDLGLQLVSKKCVLMYAPPVTSFHGFHRSLAKLFGKL